MSFLEEKVAAQKDLLENSKTGYNILQEKSLIRYQESQILNTLVNIDDSS